jgi:anti-sigma factor RsiW
MSAAIAQLGREIAPKGLSSRIESRLRSASERQTREAKRPALWRRLHNDARQVAALAACCALSALITWWLMSSAEQASRLEQEVVAAHVRSLLQDSPVQVASSDAHNVKPWFAGRVEFAPDVKDLTAEGFPLVGGRLDYVGQRRVGALVYRRRLHTVNVFMWPAALSETTPPTLTSKSGYNLLFWNKAGITYWALSDLDAGELRRLQSLL